MKYTVSAPETDKQLAIVDVCETGWEVSTFDSKGTERKRLIHDANILLSTIRMEITFVGNKIREVFPIALQNSDGSMTVATALGSFRVLASQGAALDGAGALHVAHKTIRSSMPGKILKVLCKPGDQIQADQPIMIIEAMKMENEIRAPQAGVIQEILVEPGKSIQAGELLVKLGNGE